MQYQELTRCHREQDDSPHFPDPVVHLPLRVHVSLLVCSLGSGLIRPGKIRSDSSGPTGSSPGTLCPNLALPAWSRARASRSRSRHSRQITSRSWVTGHPTATK